MIVGIYRINANSIPKAYICPSTGGWATGCPVTPYYSLEHKRMLEHALRVIRIPGARKFEHLCAIFVDF